MTKKKHDGFIITSDQLHKSRTGCFARFIPLSGTTAIKTWLSKKEAIYSWRKQKQAYKLGIGPKVMSDVKPCLIKGRREWGYKTQRANTTGRRSIDDIARLKLALSQIGFSPDDITGGYNTGKIGKRAVVIDFGSENEDSIDFDGMVEYRYRNGEVR